MKINEHDVVRLKDNREGAVVHIYPGKRVYCVEIVDDQGQTLDLVDVEQKDIAEVTWKSK